MVLWFEDDLYDALQLAQIGDRLEGRAGAVLRVRMPHDRAAGSRPRSRRASRARPTAPRSRPCARATRRLGGAFPFADRLLEELPDARTGPEPARAGDPRGAGRRPARGRRAVRPRGRAGAAAVARRRDRLGVRRARALTARDDDGARRITAEGEAVLAGRATPRPRPLGRLRRPAGLRPRRARAGSLGLRGSVGGRSREERSFPPSGAAFNSALPQLRVAWRRSWGATLGCSTPAAISIRLSVATLDVVQDRAIRRPIHSSPWRRGSHRAPSCRGVEARLSVRGSRSGPRPGSPRAAVEPSTSPPDAASSTVEKLRPRWRRSQVRPGVMIRCTSWVR